MLSCPACGHPLGDAGVVTARYCPSCGRPTGPTGQHSDPGTDRSVDWRTDTAERQRPVPADPTVARTPPHAAEAPLPARFPLYADEYAPSAAVADPVWDPPPDAPRPADDWFSRVADVGEERQDATTAPYWDDDRRSSIPWLVVALAVVVLVALGWWYLARAHG